jgi:hypothetical protein
MRGRPRSRRSVRWLGLDGNPIRRTVDRFEAVIRIALAAAFLFIAPSVAVRVGHHIEPAGLRAQQTVRHRVTATLLRDAPLPAGRLGMAATRPLVQARWTAPDGSSRTGDIHAPWGQGTGSTTTIWIDDTGRSTEPPLRHSQLVSQGVTAAVLTVAALASTVLVISQVIRLLLDRLRMAGWEAGWSIVEPRWTGRWPHR